MSRCDTTIDATDGKLRLERGTSLANSYLEASDM
jgi:hypothetical protein